MRSAGSCGGSLAWACCKGSDGGPMGRARAGGRRTFGSPCHLSDVFETLGGNGIYLEKKSYLEWNVAYHPIRCQWSRIREDRLPT